MTGLARAVATEAVRAGGRRSPWWWIAVPLAVVLPLLVTYAIAAISERFATMATTSITVNTVEPNNCVYWVINLGVLILAVGAAHAHASATRGAAANTERYLFGSPSTMILARSLFYGAIAAVLTLGLVVLLMLTLPRLFPVVYKNVDLFTSVGLRYCWAVPLFAFCAAALGVGLAALVNSGLGAMALLLLWVGIVEDAIALIPNGMRVQEFMPFLNGIYGTGQWLAITPPWGRGGAPVYFAVVAGTFVAAGIAATAIRRRKN
ncbi:MAG: ABC transporter permease [Gordonia sp. (in: high G+C Gram-positive bacteria)]|uniref:ABC transporter permease n=1 Tax=Gordonia sp. (in: high G+C Gram-positive bacteria) TaxID=84139 RepID=UPI0039E27F49